MTEVRDASSPADTKECPKCAESIKAKANVCRFCSHDMSNTEEKVFLESPARVTSKRVQFRSGRDKADSVVRLTDITRVWSTTHPKTFFYLIALILPIIFTYFLSGVFNDVPFVAVAIIYGVLFLFTGVPFILQAVTHYTITVHFQTTGGKMVFASNDKEAGYKVLNAVRKAMDETT